MASLFQFVFAHWAVLVDFVAVFVAELLFLLVRCKKEDDAKAISNRNLVWQNREIATSKTSHRDA